MNNSNFRLSRSLNAGVTLVELLVAIALMSVVTLASIALYNTSAQSYRTVDASQDLQMKARFIFTIIGQATQNAGFEDKIGRKGNADDVTEPSFVGKVFYSPSNTANTIYAIRGFDNTTFSPSQVADATYDGANDSGGVNSSDSLVIRFFGVGKRTTGETADNTMVDCSGQAHGYPSGTAAGEIPVSLFFINDDAGEPGLNCIKLKSGGGRERLTVVRGVEGLHFHYALDTDKDGLAYPNRWRTAKDLAAADWPFVRWVKVGIVLRGAPGSAQVAETDPLFPLGKDYADSSTDASLRFVPAADGRFRRAFTTVLQIRNDEP